MAADFFWPSLRVLAFSSGGATWSQLTLREARANDGESVDRAYPDHNSPGIQGPRSSGPMMAVQDCVVTHTYSLRSGVGKSGTPHFAPSPPDHALHNAIGGCVMAPMD